MKIKEAKMRENVVTQLIAPEIMCDGCVNSIKKALSNIKGISKIDVEIQTKTVTIEHSPEITKEQISGALEDIGYSTQ
jgi:copper chaperone